MTHGTKNIAVCLTQEGGVMSVPGTIVTTECKIGGEIGIVTDEERIAGTARKGHHRNRAMMPTEAMREQCRSGVCLGKLRVTCDVITPD